MPITFYLLTWTISLMFDHFHFYILRPRNFHSRFINSLILHASPFRSLIYKHPEIKHTIRLQKLAISKLSKTSHSLRGTPWTLPSSCSTVHRSAGPGPANFRSWFIASNLKVHAGLSINSNVHSCVKVLGGLFPSSYDQSSACTQ